MLIKNMYMVMKELESPYGKLIPNPWIGYSQTLTRKRAKTFKISHSDDTLNIDIVLLLRIGVICSIFKR